MNESDNEWWGNKKGKKQTKTRDKREESRLHDKQEEVCQAVELGDGYFLMI